MHGAKLESHACRGWPEVSFQMHGVTCVLGSHHHPPPKKKKSSRKHDNSWQPCNTLPEDCVTENHLRRCVNNKHMYLKAGGGGGGGGLSAV